MANDVSFVKIIDMTERKDPDTGEIRLSGIVEEILPRQHTINLSRQGAGFLNRFKAYKGKSVILQTREGVFNGRAFLSLAGSMIVPVDPSAIPVSSAASEEPDQPQTQEQKSARPLFGKTGT
jgi:hypothetical protein